MKRTATTVLILICASVLALPASAPAATKAFAVRVSVKLKFEPPQRISGKVSSPSPACRAGRRVQIQALDGSGKTELTTDDAGAFDGAPSSPLAPHKAYRVKVFRTAAGGGRGPICEGVVVTVNSAA
jgi:hypothetical protein